MTDEQLRGELAENAKPAAIATKYGISRQAVYARIKNLQVGTIAAAVAPRESERFVGHTIDCMRELETFLSHVHLLLRACDEWLRDAKHPDRYDVGPRAHEVQVTYFATGPDGQPMKRKAALSTLLEDLENTAGILSTETTHADPRPLILQTLKEGRMIVETAKDLAIAVASIEHASRFQQVVMDAIRRASPEVAEDVATAIRSDLRLHAAFAGAGAVPSAGAPPGGGGSGAG